MFRYPTYELYEQAERLSGQFPRILDLVDEALIPWCDEQGNRLEDGFIKDLPASFWNSYPWETVRLFMHLYPIYVLPTTELLDKLDELIGDFSTIEIGAGSGNIGRNLDIKMTDSYQQTLDCQTAMIYKTIRQPVPKYPGNVFRADALTAIRRFHPECVVGCYVTHKWVKGMKTGNSKGVEFKRILPQVKRLILVGNENIHAENPIMRLPHQEIQLEGLITRNDDRSADRIYVWDTDQLHL